MRIPKFNNFNFITTVRDVLHCWWVVILCGIIGVSGCYIFNSTFVGKQYTSKMTISVNLSGYTTQATAVSMARTIDIATSFTNILNSKALINVCEGETGEAMTATITATSVTDTNLITVNVTDSTPSKAYNATQIVLNNYHWLTDKSFSNLVITTIENPTLPRTVSNTLSIIKHCVFFGFVGAMIAVFLIALISFCRDTVKTEDSVEDLLDTSLFGTIPHVNKKRSKISKVNDGIMFTNPLIDHLFRKNFEDISIKLVSYNETRNIKSIVVNSVAENEGKTTICVNLALALAETGKNVAIVDADFKIPSVYKFFGNKSVSVKHQLGDYITGECDIKSIEPIENKYGVTVFSGPKSYVNSSEIVASDKFKKFLKDLEKKFDFIVIDTPPGRIAIDAETISDVADATLLVVRQDFTFVEPINDYLANINEDKMLGTIFNDVATLFKQKEDDYYYYKREESYE